MTVDSNSLAIQRTKLANQRTYLAYMRTGFGIASIAGSFKQMWIACFGFIMILGSLIQYILINNNLTDQKDPNNSNLDMVPIIYVALSIGALYLQWKK
jgi:uncharacterized membrane protein YidH (DUF202 family)